MKVLYVYDGNWPRGATRVVKQTRSLAKAGHEVHLISRNELREPRREQNAWMTVFRLPSVKSRLLNRALNFPYFFNPFWIWGIWQSARNLKADCIVVADLPLALTALWVGRALRVPVYYDVVEPYPEALRAQWQFDRMGWSDHLVRNPKIAEWVERRVLRASDLIFVVSDESRDRSAGMGADRDRLVIVGNTPENVAALGASYPYPQELERFRDKERILFTGLLLADRGLMVALEALKLLEKKRPHAVLVIVGDGPERDRVEAKIAELGLRERAAMLGWQDHEKLPVFSAHTHVGLLPFLNCNHIRITLANKLFDYMAASLPIVASDVPPMRRVLEETGAGVLCPTGDAEGLAAAIDRVLADPALRSELGRKGKAAVHSTYHWGADEERFLTAISRHLSGTRTDAHARPRRVVGA